MKISLLFSALFIFNLVMYGQSSVSLGPQLGFSSNLTGVTIGLGGSIEYTYKTADHFALRGYLGYDYFSAKSFDGYISFLPVRAGVQYFLNAPFFIFVDGGIVSYLPKNNRHKSGFSYSVGAGYLVPFGLNQRFVQVSAYFNSFYYNKISIYNWFNVRFGYGLNFKKKSSSTS